MEFLDRVGRIVLALRRLGLDPVLVGGMALVTLGSRRVTRDFDFVVPAPGARLQDLVDTLYEHDLELASRVNANDDVVATIDNRRVAASRLRIDNPASAYFQDPMTGLRVDLLFDFPLPASQLAERAVRMRVQSHVLTVAAATDLLHLKRIAGVARSSPGDAEDIAFLEALLRTP